MGRGWEEGMKVRSSMERNSNLGGKVLSLHDKVQVVTMEVNDVDKAGDRGSHRGKAAKHRAESVLRPRCRH